MLWNLLVTFGLAAIPPLESPVGQGYTAIVADEAGTSWLGGQAGPDGPSLLDTKPIFWTHSTARATYENAKGVHEVNIRETGPRPYGVQFFWSQSRRLSGKKYRLAFGAKSTSKSAIVVKCQGEADPYPLLGLEEVIRTSDEWTQYSFDFEIPRFASTIATPVFYLSDVPGIVSIRGVSLKLIPGDLAKPIKVEADIFDWYDLYIPRFRAGKVDHIVSALAPDFITIQESAADPGKRKLDRKTVVDDLDDQAGWKGQFTNGPNHVCVKKIVVGGETATVDGFTSGSFRFPKENGELGDGGYSFSEHFRDTWKLVAGRWLCIKRVNGEYVDFDRALLDSLEADHNKLRKKYKG